MMESSNTLGSFCDLGIFAVFGVLSIQLTIVSSYPLGLEARGVGIHQRLPSYLPAYNGIFSIHALNFTPSTVDKHTENFVPNGNEDILLGSTSSNSSVDRLVATDESTDSFSNKVDETNHSENDLNHESEGTASNEVESDNDSLKSPDQVTFPQIHIVTKTISEQPFVSSQFPETTPKEADQEVTEKESLATLVQEHSTVKEDLGLTHANDSEPLHAGSNEGPVEAEEGHDIFDHLMKTIQNHWLDFVGKMKLSVLDVWKSISEHMMERLESFASSL